MGFFGAFGGAYSFQVVRCCARPFLSRNAVPKTPVSRVQGGAREAVGGVTHTSNLPPLVCLFLI